MSMLGSEVSRTQQEEEQKASVLALLPLRLKDEAKVEVYRRADGFAKIRIRVIIKSTAPEEGSVD